MNAGALRQRVRFERRASGLFNTGGVVEADWAPLLGPVWASVLPLRGGEQVVDARSRAVAQFDVWIRFNTASAGVDAQDRMIDARSGETYDVQWARDWDGRRTWIRLLVQSGSHDG